MSDGGRWSLPSPFRPLPRRVHHPEILDSPSPPSQAALRRSLREMWRVNRCLGGMRGLLLHLRSLSRVETRERLSLLDVGVGRGDVPAALAERLRREGLEVRWVGLDPSRAALRAADAETSTHAGQVQGDGLRLPFADDAFDVVISTLTLHHLRDDGARAFLTEAARVARRVVLVSDLERHRLSYLGARLLAATWWRSDPVTRYDGPLSVLRSFTADELREMASRVPFRRLRIHRHFPFRLLLEGHP